MRLALALSVCLCLSRALCLCLSRALSQVGTKPSLVCTLKNIFQDILYYDYKNTRKASGGGRARVARLELLADLGAGVGEGRDSVDADARLLELAAVRLPVLVRGESGCRGGGTS